MLNRKNEMRVEAAAEKNFDTKQYTWHKYTSDRGMKLEGARGVTVSLRLGDLYGVKEYTSKDDMYLVLKQPDVVFKVPVAKSDKIMEDKSKEYKGKTPKLPTAPPSKIKIDLTAKPKKTVKQAASKIKPAQPEKVKLTANQKKIAKVKAEIKRLKTLKPNIANLRAIEKQKAELKKLNAIEKKAGMPPKEKSVAPTSKPVNPHTETKKIAAKKSKVKISLHDPLYDEDDEEIPTGSVRYGGRLIEPDELEFDDDLSGINLPIDESWSADKSKSPKKP